MWEETVKRWMDLLFWWLPKDRSVQRAQEAAEQRAPDVAEQPDRIPEQARAKPAADPVPDDLTVIKGIGPVVQEKLRSLGIRTFGDLATADPETLTEQLKGRQPLSSTQVRGWTEAAGQRAAASD